MVACDPRAWLHQPSLGQRLRWLVPHPPLWALVTQMVTARYILPLLPTLSPLLVILSPSAMGAAEMPPIGPLDLANNTGHSVKLEFQISNK